MFLRDFLLVAISVSVSIALSAFVAIAWTGPTGTAPVDNVWAPVNVGSSDQVKNGGLAINSLAVFGNAILSGGATTYLNFGSTAGSSGYGIRENNGTLELKNAGGSWTTLANTVTSVLATGAVSQIKFSDGSTQTTAATSSGLTSCRVCIVSNGTAGSGCSAYSSGNTIQYTPMGAWGVTGGYPTGISPTSFQIGIQCQ